MNVKLSRWLARAGVALLLISLLVTYTGGSPAILGASAPTTRWGPPSSASQFHQSLFEDPEGRFSVVIPKNWKVASAKGYSTLTDPDGAITVRVLSVESNNAEQGIRAAWASVDPAFALQPAEVATPPQEGVEQVTRLTYQPDNPQRAVSAMGELVQGRVYAILTDGAAEAIARRQWQLTIIQTGLAIKAVKKVDLTGVAPRRFDAQMQTALEQYIAEAMPQADIPGAAVAIVQNGRIVYEKGFGVRSLGKPAPVTPETRMMIGSVGKTMTTMMMASLVDDGKMTWDTPAQRIYPRFAVADPQLSRQITMRNLVCACTGVPRRDLDMLFNISHLTAADIVASLRTFAFFTPFGEAFQYSNQMVASGGYLAAHAAGNGSGDLYTDYLTQMQQRVFDPIGMTNTTFSFDKVKASGNYATPHSANLLGEYAPLPLAYEQSLMPVAPAGVSWSTAHDMARYLITELNHGLSPSGGRVVSPANLAETWKPQVPITAQSSYGLGWVVDQYKGLHLIQHGGNTQGFTADLAFLPESNLGIVVLTNAGHSNNFNEAVRFRLFELAFDQPKAHDAQFVYQPKRIDPKLAPPLAKLDPAALAPYLGAYHNEALGDITLRLQDGKLLLDAGEFVAELRALAKPLGSAQYIAFDYPVLRGAPVEFHLNEGGQPTAIIDVPPGYTFTKIKPSASTAAPAPTDLSKVKPKLFDKQMASELATYITTLMQHDGTPGVAVAVVQNGQIVYQQGFGVRELGKSDPVTAKTLMMIGSTTKSMTTMMMATVVEDGKLRWDTPAVQIYPSFAVGDANLTKQITLRHLVCNCTGIERRDLEFFFPGAPHTAEEVIQRMKTYSFAGTFGESYHYSNQMVATGGYLAARAATAQPSTLYDDYVWQMQQRVFAPIGMTSTTFSSATAEANPNHATPHGRILDFQVVPLSLRAEVQVQPYSPAGGAWSNVPDLARYLITQLNQGTAPDGRHVVSAKDLQFTWQPQVRFTRDTWYALGWEVSNDKGIRLLTHDGGTGGFSSNLTFLPDANLGIAVLTNAQYSTLPAAIYPHVIRLVYGLSADTGLAQQAPPVQQLFQQLRAHLQPHLDQATVALYQGVYTNPTLGVVKVTLQGEQLLLDVGSFTTELRGVGDEIYMFWDPPLAGLQIKFAQDAKGQRSLALISPDPAQVSSYVFTQVR